MPTSKSIRKLYGFFVIFVVLMSFLKCDTIKNDNTNKVRKICLYSSLPITKSDGQIVYLKDSLFITYYKDFILYRIPYTHITSNLNLDKNGKYSSESKEAKKYTYFICKASKDWGLSISEKDGSYTKRSVDSFLKAKAFMGYHFFDEKNDSLYETLNNTKGYDFEEKYVTQIKYDQSYNDTTYFFYSKSTFFDKMPFTFSKVLDSSRKAKLVKVIFLYNQPKEARREFVFEISQIKYGEDEIERELSLITMYSKVFNQ